MEDNMNRKNVLTAAALAVSTAALHASGSTSASNKVTLEGGWQTTGGVNKHMPLVSVQKVAGNTVINVVVKHPQSKAHHISAIRLYDGDRVLLSEQTLHAEASVPAATFTVNCPAGSSLIAVSDCNKHGLWMKAITI